jgi:hypothetical protein
MSESTLFGAPTHLEPTTQERWIHLLTRNWLALMGRPPRLLEADLNAMAPFFANGASPKSLKTRIYALPEADIETKNALPREVALIVDGCALITPEGRILLEVLLDLQRTGEHAIDVNRQIFALSTANTLRSEWHLRWLRNQFESSISLPVLGAGLFLLINGSVGEAQALLMPSNNHQDRELGAIVMPLIAAFSQSLGGRLPDTDTGIRQHWVFTQLSRLLGRDIAREKVDNGTATWVRTGRESMLTDELATRLARTADTARRQTAVADFVENYRRVRGPLAAFGQMHEDPTTTRRIAERLLAPEAVL